MHPLMALCWSIIVGALPLLVQSALLPVALIQFFTLAGGLLMAIRRLRYLGLVMLCACWAQFSAWQTVAPLMTMASGTQQLDVTIDSVNDSGRHEVRAYQQNNRWLFPAVSFRLRGGHFPVPLCVGQRWRLTVNLRPVHAHLNEGGFDSQRYSLARHQVLDGWVKDAQPLNLRCNVRGWLLKNAQKTTLNRPWRAVMLALIFGERQQLAPEIRQIMRETGIAHLMAISGLHIALAASLGIWLARAGQLMMSAQRIKPALPLIAGLMAAALYTWLAGAGPPTQRALLAMGLWGLIRFYGRLWTTWQVWLCCVALLIASDPIIILSDSFRLSVIAVAALIFWFQWTAKPDFRFSRCFYAITQLMWLQLGIELLILPAQVWLFHGISLWAWVTNLAVVPWVSFITLPLLFVAVFTGSWTAVTNIFWGLADTSLAPVFWLLAQLPPGWLEIDKRYVWLALLPWLLIIYWRLGLWRYYWAPGAGVIALACLPFSRATADPDWSLHMLDVGHGLAVVIERQGHALIYDTGNAWPGGSYARSTIIPWLRWHHLKPESIIISHEHMDHRGGLRDLSGLWPNIPIYSPLGWAGHQGCYQGLSWRWRGLDIKALWPPKGSQWSGNNRSCVVMISDGQHRILLTGDIEWQAELRLKNHIVIESGADVLQVAHHGSRTSSTASFIRQVKPKVALASVARYNRWRLPVKAVVDRFKKAGYSWMDTAHEGQISVHFKGKKLQIRSVRAEDPVHDSV